MQRAKRNRIGVRYLPPERPLLGKLKMMRLRRLPSTDKTWVAGHKAKVILVSYAFQLRNGKEALINGTLLQYFRTDAVIDIW